MAKQKLIIPPDSYATFDEINNDADPYTLMYFYSVEDVWDYNVRGISHDSEDFPPRLYFVGGEYELARGNSAMFTSTLDTYTGVDDHITLTFSAKVGGARTVKLYVNGVYDNETDAYFANVQLN